MTCEIQATFSCDYVHLYPDNIIYPKKRKCHHQIVVSYVDLPPEWSVGSNSRHFCPDHLNGEEKPEEQDDT